MTFMTDATTLYAAAKIIESEKQSLAIRTLVPDQSLEAEALADDMTHQDRQRYIELLAEGMLPAEAAARVGRATAITPVQWRTVQDLRRWRPFDVPRMPALPR